VKVLDFGLVARSHDAEDREEGGLTDAWIAGTPGYMAPESIRSQAPADARADIYSVGALGYFLLSGRGPFDGLSTTAVREQYLKTAPATQFNFTAWADGPLQRLIRACLDPAPEKRPASMAELAEHLRACPEANTWTLAMSAEWWSHFTAAKGGFADKTRLVDPAAVERTIKIEFGQRLPRSQG
jgi:serine/threonine-protein kinase